jgi:hypothetical protein
MGGDEGEQEETLQAMNIHSEGFSPIWFSRDLRFTITAILEQMAYHGQRLACRMSEEHVLLIG